MRIVKPPRLTTVVVGMSGGVDSSVVALLLKQRGYRVIGLFMKNWDETDGPCPAEADAEDVVQVCAQIGIPSYTVNFAQEYWDRVFSQCLLEYESGVTPNPDILCNREIKFDLFYKKALELGADYIATGHYCRSMLLNGEGCLLKGTDANKDQSYFLYAIKGEVLKRVLFPIGDMEKPEVRIIAEQHGLINAKKKDSTGICFVGKRKFKPFLQEFLTPKPGFFEDEFGNVIGKHDGVAFYTLGQRKGLGIGGPGEAWFVIDKEIARNVVVIAQGEDHARLYRSSVTAKGLSWVNSPPELGAQLYARVRYRQEDVRCLVSAIDEHHVTVDFSEPVRAVTPGQSLVLYEGDLCLGGGFII